MTRRFLLLLALALLTGCAPEVENRDVVRQAPEEGSPAAANDDPADAAPASRSEPSPEARPVILFLGTSLTAGQGLDDPALAFPGRIQARLDSADLDFEVVNGGVSGDTSAGGLRRLEWLLRRPVRVLVLELGANDGLRGQDPEALFGNLREIVRRTRMRYPDVAVVVAGMEAPPNLGEQYTDAFRDVYPRLAREEDTKLIPFLLAGVAGVPDLNQPDGIHPTVEGHQRIADVVWRALEPVVRSLEEAGAGGSTAR